MPSNVGLILEEKASQTLRYLSSNHLFQCWNSNDAAAAPLTSVLGASNHLTGLAIVAGNVGVGSTQPICRLDVAGNLNFTGQLLSNSSPYVSSQWTTGAASALTYTAGNVGVGTAAPLSPLHVVGNVLSTGTITANGSGLTNLNAANVASGALDKARLPPAFSVATDSQSVTVSSTGNVGIGTTNPLAKTHVLHTGTGDILRVDDTSPFVINLDGNVGIGTVTATTPLHVQGNGYCTGNVGIGTNVTTAKLHVVGDIYATSDITGLSDARFKRDLIEIPDALAKIRELHGYTFARSDIPDSRRYVGVLAQEVDHVLPEAVHWDASGHASVAYGNMVALLIEGIKQLEARVQALEKA